MKYKKLLIVLGIIFLISAPTAHAYFWDDVSNWLSGIQWVSPQSESLGVAPRVLTVGQGGTGNSTFTVGECLKGNGTSSLTTGACGSGGGGTTTTINSVDGPTFLFTTANDTNVTLSLASSSNLFTWTAGWTGTLANSRIASSTHFFSSSTSITAGLGLSGGGELTTNRTLTLNMLGGTCTGNDKVSSLSATGTIICTADVEGAGTFTTTTITVGGTTLSSTAYIFATSGITGLTLTGSGSTITLTQATSTASQSGFLSSADWTIFNAKQPLITFPIPVASTSLSVQAPIALATNKIYFTGTFASSGAANITIASTTGNTWTFQQATSTGSVNGFLSATDWTTFNNKQPLITFPLAVASTSLTGGVGLTLTTNDMACDTATAAVFGCLSSVNWSTFNDKLTTSSPFSTGYFPLISGANTLQGTSTLFETGGNVGIGTSTIGAVLPNGWNSNTGSRFLEIMAASLTTNDTGIFLKRSDNTIGLNIWYDGSAGTSYFDSIRNTDTGSVFFRTKTAGTPVNAFTITGAGYVGVGTTTPTYRLVIASTTDGGPHISFNPVASAGVTSLFQIKGAHVVATSTVPTVSSCGTTPSIRGTDMAGIITMGTGGTTACTITYASQWVNPPVSTVTIASTSAAYAYITANTSSTTTFTLSGTMQGGTQLHYHFFGNEP